MKRSFSRKLMQIQFTVDKTHEILTKKTEAIEELHQTEVEGEFHKFDFPLTTPEAVAALDLELLTNDGYRMYLVI